MKVISWNLNKANSKAAAYEYLIQQNADILLLQEVLNMPSHLTKAYSVVLQKCINKRFADQNFANAILFRGEYLQQLNLQSKHNWVLQTRSQLKGNLQSLKVEIQGVQYNILNIHSPAWKIPSSNMPQMVYEDIKLKQNSDIYMTEILYDLLRNLDTHNTPLIVGGDFNSSETFDWMWGKTPRGNREIIDRMESLGLKECLRLKQQGLTPTFKNTTGGKVIHQLDHIYVNQPLRTKLLSCATESKSLILDNKLSDHLPIICKFAD